MRWEDRDQSSNVEDRRESSFGGGGGRGPAGDGRSRTVRTEKPGIRSAPFRRTSRPGDREARSRGPPPRPPP
jgi:hypothetical protein